MARKRVYDVGQGVWAEGFFTHNGRPADPIGVNLRWRIPDGTVATYDETTLDNPELGRWRRPFTLTMAGVYVANWSGEGAVVSADEVFFTAVPRGVDGYLLAFYGADPNALPRDQVRLLVGDTDAADFMLLDQEIEWLLDRSAGALMATAIQAALAIAAKLSREVDRTMGDMSRSAGMRSAAYRDLATALTDQDKRERQLARVSSAPIAHSGNRNATDEGGYFSMGMQDPPGVARPLLPPPDRRAGW